MKRPIGLWLLSAGLLLLFLGTHASMATGAQAGMLGRLPLSLTYLVALIGAAAVILGLGLVSPPPPDPYR
jgi:hypothetical protein